MICAVDCLLACNDLCSRHSNNSFQRASPLRHTRSPYLQMCQSATRPVTQYDTSSGSLYQYGTQGARNGFRELYIFHPRLSIPYNLKIKTDGLKRIYNQVLHHFTPRSVPFQQLAQHQFVLLAIHRTSSRGLHCVDASIANNIVSKYHLSG
jgi:hypothetical protein